MPAVLDTHAAVAELRALLTELPLDVDQRESVSQNLGSLPAHEAEAMLQDLRETLSGLNETLEEIEGMIASSDIHITLDSTTARIFSQSLSQPA